MTSKKTLLIGILIFFVFLIVVAAAFSGKNTFWGKRQSVGGPEMQISIETLREGAGERTVNSGDFVMINYIAALQDGTTVESNINTGEPMLLNVGAGEVIKGWNDGLVGMKKGEKRKLTIPPELAYGKIGRATVPPNSTLIFEIELLEIQ